MKKRFMCVVAAGMLAVAMLTGCSGGGSGSGSKSIEYSSCKAGGGTDVNGKSFNY